jgi:ankyrin repeat protein
MGGLQHLAPTFACPPLLPPVLERCRGKRRGNKGRTSSALGQLYLAAKKGRHRDIAYFANDGVDLNESPSFSTSSALHKACEGGHVECVKALLAHGAAAQIKDTMTGVTPLHVACDRGFADIAKLLLDRGADVNDATAWPGETPLHRAATAGHVEVAELIINHNKNVRSKLIPRADVNKVDQGGRTALHEASCFGHLEVVRLLLENGAKVDVVDTCSSLTPLQEAITAGHSSIVQELLAADGARRLTKGGVFGRYELHGAALGECPEVVAPLLASGASVNSLDGALGKSALHLAAQTGHTEVAKELLRGGAQVDLRDGLFGLTPIQDAAMGGNHEVLKLLADSGGDLNSPDEAQAASALHRAAAAGNEGLTAFLLGCGADIHMEDGMGMTALHYAARGGHLAVTRMLVDRGADVEACDYLMGRRPLHEAANGGHVDVATYLVDEAEVELEERDAKGCTPLRIAFDRIHKDVYRVLLPRVSELHAVDSEEQVEEEVVAVDRRRTAAEEEMMRREVTSESLCLSLSSAFLQLCSSLGLARTMTLNMVFLIPVARVAAGRPLPEFQECFSRRWLVKASDVPHNAGILFVSHACKASSDPAGEHAGGAGGGGGGGGGGGVGCGGSAAISTTIQNFLDNPQTPRVDFVWVDISCYEEGMGDSYTFNILTALSRCTCCLFLPTTKNVEGVGPCSNLSGFLSRGWNRWQALVSAFFYKESYCLFTAGPSYSEFKRIASPSIPPEGRDTQWLSGFALAAGRAMQDQQNRGEVFPDWGDIMEEEGEGSEEQAAAEEGGGADQADALNSLNDSRGGHHYAVRMRSRQVQDIRKKATKEEKRPAVALLKELWMDLDMYSVSSLVGFVSAAHQKWRKEGPQELLVDLLSLKLQDEDFEEGGLMVSEVPIEVFGKFHSQRQRADSAQMLFLAAGFCMQLLQDFDMASAVESVQSENERMSRTGTLDKSGASLSSTAAAVSSLAKLRGAATSKSKLQSVGGGIMDRRNRDALGACSVS